MDLLTNIFAFFIAILILVFVHEFGHFWVAKKLGVKVLRFSIGFGKVLYAKTIGGTEFVLSAVPLGGYVKMLNSKEQTVSPGDMHQEFNQKPLWVRVLIVFAGPFFNFIFAVFVYWLMFASTVTGIQPVVGQIPEKSIAAQAKFQKNDRIININNISVQTWGQAIEQMIQAASKQSNVSITVKNEINNEMRYLNLVTDGFLQSPEQWIHNLGLSPKTPEVPPVIGALSQNGPAQLAGFEVGDAIIAIDGKPISSWHDMVTAIQPKANQLLTIKIQKSDGTSQSHHITPQPHQHNNQIIGRIGVQINPVNFPQEWMVQIDNGIFKSLGMGLAKTWDLSILTIRMIGKLFTGDLAFKDNIGGPISIAKFAGSSFSSGFNAFLSFLALISISLAVLNLLPIPVLDGGHLLLYLIEFIKGSPLSEKMESGLQKIGMGLILALMFFAIYFDVTKIL